MSTTDPIDVTITYPPGIPEPDIDDLVRALDRAGIDAVVAPHPSRMGLPADLPAMIVEIPLAVLGTVIVTSAGQRVWAAIVKAVQRRRGTADPASEAAGPDGVAVAIHDPTEQIRFDLAMADLADDRLLVELARLGELTRADGPVVLRWDPESAGWRTMLV